MTQAIRDLAAGVTSLADVLGIRPLPIVYDVPPDRALELDLLMLIDDARLVSFELAAAIDATVPESEPEMALA